MQLERDGGLPVGAALLLRASGAGEVRSKMVHWTPKASGRSEGDSEDEVRMSKRKSNRKAIKSERKMYVGADDSLYKSEIKGERGFADEFKCVSVWKCRWGF